MTHPDTHVLEMGLNNEPTMENGIKLANSHEDEDIKTAVVTLSREVDSTDSFKRELSSQSLAWGMSDPEHTENSSSGVGDHADRAASSPSSDSRSFWGEETHSQFATSLANELVVSGVGPGTLVLLLFPQSIHMHLATLGVVKAGAMAIVLDVDQPIDHLSATTAKLSSSVIFCSEKYFPLANRLQVGKILVLQESLSALRVTEGKSLPRSDTEQQMRLAWTKVLRVPQDHISREDMFFHLGGTAKQALQLCRIAREYGLNFSARDVFNHPTLCSLAARADQGAPKLASETPLPFSLLHPDCLTEAEARRQAAYLCQVPESQVLDILPCTPLQEGLLSLTTKQHGDYVARNVFELQQDVDTVKFRAAWDQVVALNPILRTRIASIPNQSMVQVELEADVSWTSAIDLDDYLQQHQGEHMTVGTPLTRFAILQQSDAAPRFFLWEVHHALYDGWSIPLLMKEAENAYYEQPSENLEPIAAFIKYIHGCDKVAAKRFWVNQFANLQGKHFPSLALGRSSARPNQQTAYRIQDIRWTHGDVTTSNIIRSAWAVTVARFASSTEALFGTTVTGRQAPLANIKRMAGPTIATVPVRVVINWDGSVNELLHSVQRQAVDMISYEQTGLQNIRRFSDEAAYACNFQSLLVVQPAVEESNSAENLYVSGSAQAPQAVANQWQDFSSYAIVIECQLEPTGLQVCLAFDSSLISEAQIQDLLQNLEHVLLQFVDKGRGSERLGTVVANDSSLEPVWTWNEKVPEPIELVVHDMILHQCHLRPYAPAICAWDGDLTYGQLDELSTLLACQLLHEGLKPGDIVALFFEKSMWMPVAALAVMKSGAASVALDISLPEKRLLNIISSVGSTFVLSSTAGASASRKILPGASNIIPVGPELLIKSAESGKEDYQFPVVSPASLLYVVFTSGSTGQPKGVMISHRNFCSAIHYQQEAQGFVADARVFDFASYSFDASWANILQTLTAGACLCIPSALERHSQLEESFVKYGATMADLTPSVARSISPEVLSRMNTLLLGGEAVLPSDSNLAGTGAHTQIINLYGPAECTPTVTVASITGGEVSIGRGRGVCTWVVDPDNASQLAAIGATGELWIEGPLVGDGYFNNPDKTAASFVHNPEWLLQGSPKVPGRHGRLYRTGDLVKYKVPYDGTLIYVGRNDTQVKIRGQRLELGEVEHHVLQALAAASLSDTDTRNLRVTAATVKPNGMNSLHLIAFITFDVQGLTEESHHSAVRVMTAGLADWLATIVPAYMVPDAFIPLHRVPLTATGKTDNKRLQSLGEESWLEYYTMADGDETTQPVSDMEKQLQQVWMSVLNLSASEVPANKSFVRLGGDSISAMQVVSRARLRNIEFTVTDVLQTANIEKLALCCRNIERNGIAKAAEIQSEDYGNAGTFNLSPVQQMFFKAYPDGLDHWNQSFTLKLNKRVRIEAFIAAIRQIVSRHPMLRARFEKQEQTNDWVQSSAADDESSFAFTEHSPESVDAVNIIGNKRQTQLDIRRGPVFAVDFFTMPDGSQTVILTAHHLVIDLVSWRIVWNDIEEHIEFGKFLSESPVSFQSWCGLQAKVGRNLSPLSVLPFSIPEEDLTFWGLLQSENTFGNCETYTHSFDKVTSSLLFGKSNEALHTEVIDIILGMLAHSFYETFPERSVPPIWLEGHGRNESEDFRLDISGTVGWFTTIYPIPVAVTAQSTGVSAIRLAKDLRRQVPDKGLPYFTCRYLSESGRDALKGHDTVEVMLNFTGSFQQLEGEAGLFTQMDQSADGTTELIEVSELAQRTAMIEISADVSDGHLSVSFQVQKGMSHQDRLHEWTIAFARALRSTARVLLLMPPTLTLSDLPLLPGFTHHDLDMLQKELLPSIGIKVDEVANMYPCSPLQEGILLSSHKGTASYATFSIFRCLNSKSCSTLVDPVQLESAWAEVVSRHSILATVFCMNPRGNGFLQVVLKKPKLRISTINTALGSPDMALLELERPDYKSSEPQHSLTICCSTETSEVACRLDISHALIDATSISILVQELVAIYDGRALQAAPCFSQVIGAINKLPRTRNLATWATLLDGVGSCLFPTSAATSIGVSESTSNTISIPAEVTQPVAHFCREMSITQAAFLQVAWALVLGYFTCMDDVCFGYLASGRDAPLDGIDSIVGPLSNMLIGRVNLQAPARQVFQTTAKQLMQSFSIQNTSLVDIQHSLGLAGKRLFNTTLSIRPDENFNVENANLSLENVGGEDPHEFEIGLSASSGNGTLSVLVEFRGPDVSRSVAQEACDVLIKAIEYLRSVELGGTNGVNSTASTQKSLSSGFFEYVVGAEQAETRSFWQSELRDTPEAHSISNKQRTASFLPRDITMGATLSLSGQATENIQVSTVLQAAWGITLARLAGAEAALFGAIGSFGQNTNMVPIRLPINWQADVSCLLQDVRRRGNAIAPYAQASLQWIRGLGENVAHACDFQTVLVIMQDACTEGSSAVRGLLGTSNLEHYPLIAECQVVDDSVEITMRFDPDLGLEQVARIGHQFRHVVGQLCSLETQTTKLIDVVLDPLDLKDIWSWNSLVPQPVAGCFHDVFTQRAREQPLAPAICAWDGELTYQQLDLLSSALARHLIARQHLCVGSVVSLCFEKSMWMPVCALAVAKAGAASVAMDPTVQPEERLRAMSKSSQLILCSLTYKSLASRLGTADVFVIRPGDFGILENSIVPEHDPEPALPIVESSHRFCIQFTSGSTGTPKGVVLTHQNVCAALVYQNKALGYRNDSRVFDFASYAFDVAWSNFCHTLAAGGCLCIPSNSERQDDITGSIFKYNVSFIDLTPSFARTLPPSALTNLTTLCLGGEAVLPSDMLLGGSQTTTIAAYGPAECTPTSTIQSARFGGAGIGRGAGLCTWVVDAANADVLASVGAVGELWLEGPLVGQGYLNDPDATSQVFVEDPPWLLRGDPATGQPGRRGRLYRTGDLVRYHEDGSLLFMGRKDTQVKLRGQRVELGEVEHQVRQALEPSLEGGVTIVAETFTPRDSNTVYLAAFVSIDVGSNRTDEEHNTLVHRATASLPTVLAHTLPSYMVPSAFIPMRSIPMTPTGKMDRNQIRRLGSSFSVREIGPFSGSDGKRGPPQSRSERRLQALWAEVLKVSAEDIGIDDSFFRLGGDSIGAMQLVALARQENMLLTVGDVFRHPTLFQLAGLEAVGAGLSDE